MAWHDEPLGGGTGGSATPPATPETSAQPARSTNDGQTRATLDAQSLHVWLQAVDPLSTDSAEVDPIGRGITTRLQQLFTLVADRPGPPQRVQVLWTDDVAAENSAGRVRQNDIVIYFTSYYDPSSTGSVRRTGNSSVVKRYLLARASQESGELAREYRQQHDAFFGRSATPHEGGLAYPDNDGATTNQSTSVCEVFVDVMREANRVDAGATNRTELLQNQVGFAMAGMAYHEAMHNKVDPFARDQNANWDLHTMGGGGLAEASFGAGRQHTPANINTMAQHLNRARRQYILSRTTAASPSTAQPVAQPTP